jgi:group I intron endonuclease
MGGIYRVVNLTTGKKYIGSTYDFKKRNREHFTLLKGNRHPNTHLQYSFNKYGESNFRFEILAKCPKEYLLKLEQWFIDSQNPEYNIAKYTLSPMLGRKMSKESRELIGLAHRGKVVSKETREKLSKTKLAQKIKLSPETIKKLVKARIERGTSVKTREKLSIANKGKKPHINTILAIKKSLSRPVRQYTLDNELIQEWESISEACRQLNLDTSRISLCCRGKAKTTGGFKWKYL